MPQFAHQENKDNNRNYLIRVAGRMKELIYAKSLKQVLKGQGNLIQGFPVIN